MNKGWASSAVLWRESARTSRRWQTYATRAGFSGALLALLLFGIWASMAVTTADWVDKSDTAWMGRVLFITFTVMQMVISLFMAPMTTARAVIEERLEGTLDLLVLTPLSAGALLGSKVLSRLLVLITVVLGSLPLLALVTTLGGVSVTEVVLVTVGNVVTLFVMGAMGAYFGLFTKSPVIASLAAAGWALLAFLGLPALYALITASTSGSAHVSPFFASAGDWWGLVLPLTWVPTILLTWVIGTRLFRLKMANAELRRYFSDDVWQTRKALIWGGVFLGLCVTVLPLGTILAWMHTSAVNGGGHVSTMIWALGGAGRALSWVWTQGLVLLCTWFYLRLGMDLVDAFEGMLGQMGRDRARRRKSRGHRIWRNPIAWREARVSAWGRGGLPLLIGWGLVLFAILQSGLWLIPGGVLTVGAANAAAALLLTCWLAAGSIEQERHGRSLEMLLVSRMSSTRIVWGKLFALMFPTLPVLLISIPLFVIGFPHLEMLFSLDRSDGGSVFASAVGRGLFTSVWLLGFWLFAAMASMWVALRVRTPATAYGAAVGLVAAVILVPTFLAWVLSDWYWVSLPFRVVMPVAVKSANPFELLFSTGLFTGLGLVLFVYIAARIRAWGGRA